VRLPAVYLGAFVLGGGVFGAWGGELVYVSVLGLVLMHRFGRGSWQSLTL